MVVQTVFHVVFICFDLFRKPACNCFALPGTPGYNALNTTATGPKWLIWNTQNRIAPGVSLKKIEKGQLPCKTILSASFSHPPNHWASWLHVGQKPSPLQFRKTSARFWLACAKLPYYWLVQAHVSGTTILGLQLPNGVEKMDSFEPGAQPRNWATESDLLRHPKDPQARDPRISVAKCCVLRYFWFLGRGW